MTRRFAFLYAMLFALVAATLARGAAAAPEAHILRIDPRAGLKDGKPVLTTVIEVVQLKRMSDALQACSDASTAATASCWSDQLEKPEALWEPFPFPEQNAHLLVKVSGEDQPAKFIDKTTWGKSKDPNAGTAWLVAVDSSAGMGSRFGDARAIAHELIEQMQPNDLMDLMFFDDMQVVRDTKWKTFKQRAELGNALNEFKSTSMSHGRDRALFSEIKSMTQDAFRSLGNSDQPDAVPLHQAMVVLSNGAGRGDPESASPTADVFHQYLNRGRFPEDNVSLPKTPLPVISIWLPNGSSLTESIYRNNEAQFMQALANPEIGGFFDIVQEGQGDRKAKTIIGLVRARFNAMWLVHWTLSCINPSVEQTFDLVFENTHPMIAPDGTFKDVPIGIDPAQWPLDVDVPRTMKAAQDAPLYPGGQVSVYGDFCWSGDKQRAEAYFIPAGTKPAMQAVAHDVDAAKSAMQRLQAEHMLGVASATGDGYATFAVPDDDKVLDGSGENTVARLVVYDNKTHRASAIDDRGILTLKATKKPISLPLVSGIAGLLLVIALLTIVLVRSGSARPTATAGAPGYGAPGPYGVSPAGYGAPADPLAATAAVHGGAAPAPVPPNAFQSPAGPGPVPMAPLGAAGAAPPAVAIGARDAGAIALASTAASPPIMQVRCPACGKTTMATPGQPSVCFSCGQPLPVDPSVGASAGLGGFTAVGAYGVHPTAPPGPYGSPPPNPGAGGATLRGAAGQFAVRGGAEVRVGRDPAQCTIFLSEPRVSGVHATLKMDGGMLVVRDEGSNNGTWVSGMRIAPGVWTAVAPGTPLRFGPLEFTMQLET